MAEYTCPPDHAHDENSSCYVIHKCRCPECRQGRAEYEFWRKHMHAAGRVLLVDATGTRRRVRALGALGWSHRMVGARMGLSGSTVSDWMRRPRVSPATAARVRAVYDELSMILPDPQTRVERNAVAKTRNDARRRGYPPPLCWDDDTIDDPAAVPDVEAIVTRRPERIIDRLDAAVVDAAVDGEQPHLSPLERREAIKVLNARPGWSARRIAEWIGCNPKTVERIRAELDLPVFYQRKEAA